ncbi:hypothetical protein [Enterobacter ludwigii]|uniref:hypothetical protein n=1 Tax=Enterobacter ludwigii TaxID=299767 RepID=UPI0013D4C72C|nr:hypothetical protein [Enterobacter ludwigii]
MAIRQIAGSVPAGEADPAEKVPRDNNAAPDQPSTGCGDGWRGRARKAPCRVRPSLHAETLSRFPDDGNLPG